ncbi:MAG: hypothetical protein MUC57_12430 [Desulfobacterales bacterium]|nr:hypothetical protein [Desulfobacterales bacterium]
MKHLRDHGLAVPPPIPSDSAAPSPANRIEAGCDLLARFFADGRIRGLMPGGEIYEHRIAPGLTERFLKKFNARMLKGTS